MLIASPFPRWWQTVIGSNENLPRASQGLESTPVANAQRVQRRSRTAFLAVGNSLVGRHRLLPIRESAMANAFNWPEKRRELHNHHFDSTIWNDFNFRDDDIVIGTYAKAGTTWMQQIIARLLFDGDPDLEVAEMSPWMDLRVPPKGTIGHYSGAKTM